MSTPNFFFNRAGRLRSGWRFAAFVVADLLLFILLLIGLQIALALGGSDGLSPRLLETNWGFALQAVILLVPAVLVGWGCNRVLEDLPWRALGWTLHRGWARDLLLGALLGMAWMGLAAGVVAAAGGYRFALTTNAVWPAVARTLALSGVIFALAAAAEEALFRGYPLQTLLRSWPAWVAVVPTSVLFALVHQANPNVVRGFTFLNTALAGVWLAVAYVRTRSLWFPLGLHWGWNWTMGSVLGLPVSGITAVVPAPLLRATDAGPDWLTGGTYGVEGGAACTLVLVLSTVFTWRVPLLAADGELKRMTSEENPTDSYVPISIR